MAERKQIDQVRKKNSNELGQLDTRKGLVDDELLRLVRYHSTTPHLHTMLLFTKA